MSAYLLVAKNHENFSVDVVSKPGSTAANILGIGAVVLAIVSLAVAIILILGAVGVIPTVTSLISISSLGIALGTASAFVVLSTIFLTVFVSTVSIAILLLKYAKKHEAILLRPDIANHTQNNKT